MKNLKQLIISAIYTGALLFSLSSNLSYAQVPTTGDCLGAIPVCEAFYFQPLTSNGVGNYPNEVGNGVTCPYNCLDGEINSVWYQFTVQESGILSFIISPVDANDDYDWALYNLTLYRCEDIVSHMSALTFSCNSAGGAGLHGNTGAYNGADDCAGGGNANGNTQWNANIPVVAGQTFVLYISDWTQSPTGYSLDFSPSTAVIFDDVPPYIFSVDAGAVSGCDETEIGIMFSENVTCSGVSPYLFSIEGPGGPYQVTEVFGSACSVGGEWEKEFMLSVDHPFSSNGTYTLYMATGFPGVQDACNNIALADTLSFILDLGAPLIDEAGLQISEATCGMDNGSITGLIASGQTSLSYVWKNSQGAIVGNLLDLVNVPAESYSLEVYDLNDCITYAGPYDIPDVGAPEIDETNMIITSSNYGASNGSITGIIVNASAIIDEYIWRDDQGGIAGSNLDLTGVSTGYYDLTVIDENTCEVNAGPWFVGEIGGPLTVNPSANPDVICRGEYITLSPGAAGGSGIYEYLWTSTPAGFSSTLENPVVSPLENTTYHLKLSDGYLIDSTAYVDVTVHQLPIPDAGLDQNIPHGTSTVLHGTASIGSGDYFYAWTPVEKLEDATLSDPTTKNLYATTPFFLEVTDEQTGCSSEGPDEVIVNITGGILSVHPSSFPDSVFCLGESFWLHANAGGGSGSYTYLWTSEPVMNLPATSSFEITLTEAGTYFFYVKINDGYNDAFGYVEVRVDPAPQIDLGPPLQIVCPFDTIVLNAGNPGSEYLWSNGATTQSITVGTTGLGNEEQEFSVMVINQEGCEAETSVLIVFDYDACVGITEHLPETNVKVFPNPTSGNIVVEVYDVSSPLNMCVYNMLGEIKMHSMLLPGPDGSLREEFDLSALARGVYIIKFYNNKSLKITEIILK
ncbi:MAG: T9SS type A sorting domain-containing protein [Bacteroidetes bacterium]|nr:T9SS type A sorting domain-containing protein [Bacteroidota bacterium]